MIVRYEGYKSSPVPGGTLGQVEATLYDMHQDTWDENMHQEKKIHYGNFFYFCAHEYIYKRIPKDENPPMKGF